MQLLLCRYAECIERQPGPRSPVDSSTLEGAQAQAQVGDITFESQPDFLCVPVGDFGSVCYILLNCEVVAAQMLMC